MRCSCAGGKCWRFTLRGVFAACFDVRVTIGFFVVVAGEDQEDGAAAFAVFGVAVFPDLGIRFLDLFLAAGIAKRRLHPARRGLAGLDAGEGAFRHIFAGLVLAGVARDETSLQQCDDAQKRTTKDRPPRHLNLHRMCPRVPVFRLACTRIDT